MLDERGYPFSIGRARIGVEFQKFLPGIDGLVPAVQIIVQYDAFIEKSVCMFRIDRLRLPKSGKRLIEFAAFAVHDAEIRKHIGIVRGKGQRAFIRVDGLRRILRVKMGIAERHPLCRSVGVALQRLFRIANLLLEFPGYHGGTLCRRL